MELIFVGDVRLADESRQEVEMLLSERLKARIEKATIRCCNLEGPMIKEGEHPVSKAGPSVAQGRMALERLKDCGFNLFNLANNHIMDYGTNGLRETLVNITNMGTKAEPIGADIQNEKIYSLFKIRDGELVVGIVSASESGFGISTNDTVGHAYMLDKRFMQLIKQAKLECQIVVVICHCGAEELEVPLPEVRALYQYYIDLGATVVIGHHPHVIQGSEEYKNGKIFYSLGNFAFDSLDNPRIPYNPEGLCVRMCIDENGIEYDIISTIYCNGVVDINEENNQFMQRSLLLQCVERYNLLVNEFCRDIYEKAYKTYYCQAVGFHDCSIIQRWSMALRLLLGKKIEYNEDFIYHNSVIETNQWIYKHAIEGSERFKKGSERYE